jgi:Spy/CpxP family protein refolding chaperone
MSKASSFALVGRFALTAVLGAAVGLAAPETVRAQSQTELSSASTRVPIEELTAQWASLERPLLGVPDVTDLQRDAIELLEERYRKQFNYEAVPIRNARVALLQRGPFERQAIELALQRMTELRKRELVQLRSLLTEAQRVPYDANLRAIAAEEAAADAKREREAQFYTP